MKIYNFDEIVDRNGSGSVKYDGSKRVFKEDNLFPMWVADMDFKTPQYITDAIIKRVNHGLFGYPEYSMDLFTHIINWIYKKHNWRLNYKNFTLSPTVVASLSVAIEAFSKPNDKIIIQTPVYGPFYSVIETQNRIIIENPLVEENGYYSIDFEHLESIIDENTSMLLLCSPHNPIGRVWKKEELEKLGDICLKNNIKIISDEIHSDIVYSNHTPIASISDKLSNITLTLNSPGKTFNISGLEISYAYTENLEMLKEFKMVMKNRTIGVENVISLATLEASYTQIENYINQLNKYLESNIDFTIDYLNKYLPKLKISKPEGTYLLWLDFRSFDLSHKEINDLLLKKGKVALTDGLFFGKNGDKFFRLNVALPKSRLQEGLSKLVKSFE
jgi:cystathionine beta-lyase